MRTEFKKQKGKQVSLLQEKQGITSKSDEEFEKLFFYAINAGVVLFAIVAILGWFQVQETKEYNQEMEQKIEHVQKQIDNKKNERKNQ